MLARSLVALLVLSGAADDLVTMRLQTFRLKTPAAWSHTVTEGTHRWQAPSGDANIILDTGKTAAPMDAGACLDKIIANESGGEWTRLSIGASPAARRFEVIHNEHTNSDIHEYTYVGCNGVSTWSLIYRFEAVKKDRFTPLADRVASSLEYIRAQ
jgi:hypothetical protein